MTRGDRVLVHRSWSSFFGREGTVEEVEPLMILIDGEQFAMRFGETEVQRLTETRSEAT
jgi:hypothetical protein